MRSLPSIRIPYIACLIGFASLLLLCFSASVSSADEPDEAPQIIENATGTIQKVGNFGYGLVPDSEPGTRYAPTEPLDAEFQQDGLRVRFSGKVGDPAESPGGESRGRRWGTPFEVTHIERLPSSD